MRPVFNNIAELIAHEPPMILLDAIQDWGNDFVESVVNHTRRHSFWTDDDRVPAYVGMEYMAQTIALYSGIQSKLAGQPIRIGLLLGTRHYDSNVSYFHANQAVSIRVAESYRNEDNMSVFDCSIIGDEVLIAAQIKAIQPHSLDDILQGG